MPVAWFVDGGKRNGVLLHDWQYLIELVAPKIMCKPLYASPVPAKTLTDAEIKLAYCEAAKQELRPQDKRIVLAFARAIEQVLKGGA